MVVTRVDCSADSIALQLQAALDSLRDSRLAQQRAGLILGSSVSPVAQSYRNALQTGRNEGRWAGLVLKNDVQEALKEDFEFRRSHPGQSEIRAWLLSWQQEILRGDFPDDVPWSVIADWYDDHDDSERASRCRQFEHAHD